MMNEYNPDGKDIRFIDSHYKDFHIPDGGCIQIEYPNETIVSPANLLMNIIRRLEIMFSHLPVCRDYGA